MVTEDYVRNAKLVRVIDGDTLVVDIDLGFNIWRLNQHVRLLGINCPELHGKTAVAGLGAKMFTEKWVVAHPVFVIKTHIDQKRIEDDFGRVLAEVWDGSDNLCADLLSSGNAVVDNG